ncbi:triple QxxK/R motif-containing protein [Huso huso]|uniref:Triple QxxK/R motif-containing protein n=1 Tax=Huso huso TaxID=61971 RepID=A0ABR1A130_HUSHU
MGRKEATSSGKLPVDQYQKQIGKPDYKKKLSAFRATRLKAEAKRNAPGLWVGGCLIPFINFPYIEHFILKDKLCEYDFCKILFITLQNLRGAKY